MITELTGQNLPQWISDARAGGLPGISSFAKGLEQDLDAVTQGLTSRWNSGPVEGRVNPGKMIKRQMFGRAALPLLGQCELVPWGGPRHPGQAGRSQPRRGIEGGEAMSEQIHLIIRLSGDGGVYATLPQAPGLVYGRVSLEELRSDLDAVLSFHFGRPGPFDVIEHHERHYDVADRELVTRLAVDEHRDQRQAVYERIGQVLSVPGQAESLVSTVTNRVGETVYVCAVPSDTLGWLAAQLDGHRDALVGALTIADHFLLSLPIAADDGTPPAWSQGSSTPETELSEIVQKIPVVTPPQTAPLEVV